MEIFIDSAKLSEIKKWLDCGIADGVTTNPSIMFKDGVYDIEKGTKEIARLINPRPVSVEVTTNNLEEMLKQGRTFAKWAPNIAIKVPIMNQDGFSCLGVIKKLSDEGIKINATAMMSFGQAILAAKAGATYLSLFAGRMEDEGQQAGPIIRAVRSWLDDWGYKSKIIVGSIRTVMDIQSGAQAGAHVITIPQKILDKMVDHKYTRETVRQFRNDAQRALTAMGKK